MTRKKSFALGLICSIPLWLPSIASAGGWSAPVSITNYFVWIHGGAFIATTGNLNPDGCTAPDMLYLDSTQPEFRSTWALVLSAYAQGQTISVDLDGCDGGRAIVRAIAVPAIW